MVEETSLQRSHSLRLASLVCSEDATLGTRVDIQNHGNKKPDKKPTPNLIALYSIITRFTILKLENPF